MHRAIKPIKQRNSRRVQNDINSRERDATLVRHCFAQDSDRSEKAGMSSGGVGMETGTLGGERIVVGIRKGDVILDRRCKE